MGYYQKLHVSVVSTSIELKADLIFLGGGFPRFLKNEAKKDTGQRRDALFLFPLMLSSR